MVTVVVRFLPTLRRMDDDVRLAEQALVGGLILEPHRLGEVAGLLSPADFGSPACGLVFERMLGLRAAATAVTATALLDAMRERGELRSDGYPISGAVRWLDQVPAAASLPAYARLVVEGSACRRVERAGLRLVQLAGQQDRPVRALLGAAGVRSALVAELRRLGAPTLRPGSPAPAGGSVPAMDGSPARPVDEDLAHAELATVGSVLWAPSLMYRLRRWLEPADFGSAECGVIFGRITTMVRDGVPVDRVTVRDQMRRHGDLDDARAASVLSQADAAVSVPASATFYGQQVLAGSVSRRVHATGERLIGLGRSRLGGGPAVVAEAVGAVDALGELRMRLWRSGGPVGSTARTGVVRRSERMVRPELYSAARLGG